MDANRRSFLEKAATVGAGVAAASLVMGHSKEAVAAPIGLEINNSWTNILYNHTYVANANIAVSAVIYRKNGDFRGAIDGFVQAQRRAAACAGWSGASGMSRNSLFLIVRQGEQFRIAIADDFGNHLGATWDVDVFASGPVQQIS
jgi:hypothetical protein